MPGVSDDSTHGCSPDVAAWKNAIESVYPGFKTPVSGKTGRSPKSIFNNKYCARDCAGKARNGGMNETGNDG
jgi:hypothetical protein